MVIYKNGDIEAEKIYKTTSTDTTDKVVMVDSQGILKSSNRYLTQTPDIDQAGRQKITGTNGYWYKKGTRWFYKGMVLIIGTVSDSGGQKKLNLYNTKQIGNLDLGGSECSYDTSNDKYIGYRKSGSNGTDSDIELKFTWANTNIIKKILKYTKEGSEVTGFIGWQGAFHDSKVADIVTYANNCSFPVDKVLCIPFPQLYLFQE